MKRMTASEFRESGLLQEVNRQFFHPRGLALELVVGEGGEVTGLGGIQDHRDEPEGMVYPDLSDQRSRENAARASEMLAARASARLSGLGYVVQPVGDRRE